MDYPVTKTGEAVAYVDGSYNDQTCEYGAGVAFFCNGELTEFSDKGSNPEAATMRNVSGEVMAAMIAMREAHNRGMNHLVIYHDYQGIADWCTGAWKTKKEGTRIYKEYYQQMRLSGLNISFVKVEGHSGDVWNDHADMLARRAVGK
ncbi:MAG: reverse transcriptase-like protein [Eubacterium sp.]|nr:reverse transcriptase-like protein [Eubacterium sp.]MBQ7200024.1 reverse transcriptase-like protein [Eubacterium sp.]MBR0118725.1 reverse transcriptase-like protein [Eubacterium sp.]